MKFSDKQLNSFIELYKQEFGENIDQAEALRQATALVSLVKNVYKPMSKKDFEIFNKLSVQNLTQHYWREALNVLS